MKIKRILWVVTALIFANVLYAQVRGGGGASQPTSTQAATPGQNSNNTQVQSDAQKAGTTKGQAQTGPVPMTEKEVMKELKSSTADALINEVNDRGVDFDMTPDKEKKLRKAKATDEVITAVKNGGPAARARFAKMTIGTAGVKQIPREQAQAFQVIKGELDPDKAVALCDDFKTKYPDSVLVSFVDYFEANAYQQKGDAEKAVQYGDDCLKHQADNLMCLVLKVSMLPQPQYLNAHDADRDKILQEAESEGAHALQLIPQQLTKNPNETDADYKKRIDDIASGIHGPLGMVHLDLATGSLLGIDKKELAKSEEEFTAAVTMAQHPDARDYFRLGEAYSMDGKVDEAIGAFSKASDLGQGTLIKTYADQRIEALKKQKTATATPSH
jgi:tetratricopeptide (TPR) repeat protein